MWDLKACRCCLLITEGALIRITENHKKTYNLLTGLQIKTGDGFPTYICVECSMYLKKSMQFRRKTRRAFFVLQNIMATKKQVMLRDIIVVNRKSCNLESSLSFTAYEIADIPAQDPKSVVDLGNINVVFRNSDQINILPNCNTNIDSGKTSNVASSSRNVASVKLSNVANSSCNIASGQLSNVGLPTLGKLSNVASGKVSNVASGKVSNVASGKLSNVASGVSSNVDSGNNNDSELSKSLRNITSDNTGNYSNTDIANIADVDDTNDFANEVTVMDEESQQLDDQNIDLEDVFKGLQDDDDYCVESEPEEVPMPPSAAQKKKKEKKEKKKTKKKEKSKKFASGLIIQDDAQKNEYNKWLLYHTTDQKYMIKNEYIDAIANNEVTYLTREQQAEVFKKRLQSETFVKGVYKCAICIKVFSELETLMYHVKIHNEGKNFKYSCKICKIQCETRDKLLVHSANAHWYTYTCKTCDELKYTVQELNECYKKHYPSKDKPFKIIELDLDTLYTKIVLKPQDIPQTMHLYSGTPSPHSCDKCRIYFPRALGLEAHLLLHEVPAEHVPYYTCDICNIHFPNNKPRLENHITNWHQYGYKCKWCSAYLYNRYQAKHHMLCHQKISCDLCDTKKPKNFISKKGLELHKSKVHPALFYKEFCNLCGKAYNTLLALYNHQFSDHGYLSKHNPEIGNPDYKCNHCDVAFVDKASFYKHVALMQHTQVDSVEHICRKCYEPFDTNEEKIKHPCKRRRYPARCKMCGKMLYDNIDEVTHNVTHHPNGNNEEITIKNQNWKKITSELCDLCGMVVKHTSWSRHQRFHKKFPNGLFSCVYCGIKLYSGRYYFGHILWHHTRNPYMCRACPSRFEHKWECKDHILRVHAPEKPYSCDFCKRQFSHLVYLSEHTLRMHGAKPTTSKYHTKPFHEKINIYPLMKIDATHIPLQLIELVELVKSDYLDQHLEPIENYQDYLVFDSTEAPIIKKKAAKEDAKTKKRKSDATKEVPGKKTKTVQGEGVDLEYLETENAIESITQTKEKGNIDVETEVDSNCNKLREVNADLNEDCEQEEFLEDNLDSYEETVNFVGFEDNLEEEIVESQNIEIAEIQEDKTNINIEDIHEQIEKGNYDVVEHEGEQCLLVNGVVFKIETE